jgi:hypothetical protein
VGGVVAPALACPGVDFTKQCWPNSTDNLNDQSLYKYWV